MEELKNELAAPISKNTRLSQIFDDIRTKGVVSIERLGASGVVLLSIVEDTCASLEPSLEGLIENFCVGLNKSVNEAFRAGSTGSKFHTNTSIDDTTPPFSEGPASD